MKITHLNLLAFGPFTDKRLDFSAGEFGLHLVYGSNEAGKSSTLRAITNLLYGFPSRTDDNFIHSYKNLRIGGTLQQSNGKKLKCVRLKANSKTLRSPDETTVLDEHELQRMLGDVDRELFHAMFGIDHHRLRQGGEEIVRGDGRVGELLFAAGAGVVDLQSLQTRLQAKCDELFKSTGRKGFILDGIKEYLNARAATKNAQVSVEVWKTHDDALATAEKKKQVLDQEIREFRAEQNRLSRLRDAIPTISRLQNASAELTSLGNVPLLADDFLDQSNRLVIELRKAQQKKLDAEESCRAIEAQIEGVSFPTEIVQQADALHHLRDRLGAIQKAASDRPNLITKRDVALGQAEEILKRLGRDASTQQELERLPADKTVRIQNLGNQHEGLIERLNSARRDCDRLQREIERNSEKIAAIPQSVDCQPLRETVRRIQQQGDLELQLEELQTTIEQQREESDLQRMQLPLWEGSLDDLENVPSVSLATIERFDTEFRNANGALETVDQQQQKLHQAQQVTEQELARLESDSAVPTVEQLNTTRQLRDTGWQLLCDVWQQQEKSNELADARVLEYIETAEAADLQAAFQLYLGQADEIADRLRSDAERVAQKAQLQLELSRQREEAIRLCQSREQAEADLTEVSERWCQQWQPLGFEPLTPVEMRDWLRQQQELLAAAKELRANCRLQDRLEDRIYGLRSDLEAALDAVGVRSQGGLKSLTELVDSAVVKSDAMQEALTHREQLVESLDADKDALVEAQARRAESEQAFATWQTEWGVEMQRLNLEADASPAQANSVLTDNNTLFQLQHEAEQFRVRIAGIDRDTNEFEQDLGQIVSRLAPELAQETTGDALNALLNRLHEATTASDKQRELMATRSQLQEKMQAASETISTATVQLQEMCRQANCDEYDEFAEAFRKSSRQKDLQRTVEDLKQQLVAQSGGSELDEFVAVAQREAGGQIDSLPPRLEELDAKIEKRTRDRDELVREIERAEAELRRVDGSADAAEQAAACESISTRIEQQIHQLAVLRLAATVLHNGIERHRDKNQDPILNRASELFSLLTSGKYSALRADFTERGEPVLTGTRSVSGESIHVTGMSDGTCDQLYLALRLASLEAWLEDHEPIPFVVDDVLLNFDDDRSAAALKAFAELSRRTQVIFFTHHQHLVELASSILPEDVLFVHSLESNKRREFLFT